MRTVTVFAFAAFFEIVGCYAAWMWLRLGRSPWWMLPGVASLLLFALLLTQAQAGFAGRAFAAYGGVYIVASLVWLWAVERMRPDLSDLLGAVLCLVGAVIILFGRRVLS